MKKLGLILMMVLFCSSLNAQSRIITGIVTSAETGELIESASVFITGTTSGVLTDKNGAYSIDVLGKYDQLEFGAIGYIGTTITLGVSKICNVSLHPQPSQEYQSYQHKFQQEQGQDHRSFQHQLQQEQDHKSYQHQLQQEYRIIEHQVEKGERIIEHQVEKGERIIEHQIERE